LAAKLDRLIAAPQQVEELRERAQHFARDNYNWEKIVDQYERLFEGMLR
jgi:glycosyltransferase involved in cell wall biosynthesis